MKLREASGNGDMISRLEVAETKLQELKSNMGVLGKEAVAAMTAVEAQQQRLTLQRLIALVNPLYSWVFLVVIWLFSCKYWVLLLCVITLVGLTKGWIWKELPPKGPTNSWSAWKRGTDSFTILPYYAYIKEILRVWQRSSWLLYPNQVVLFF